MKHAYGPALTTKDFRACINNPDETSPTVKQARAWHRCTEHGLSRRAARRKLTRH